MSVGLATDGDADRLGVMDEEGRFITQLQTFALLVYYLLEVRGQRGAVVRSITTTSMADKLGKHYGVPVYETAVGFKYIGPLMMQYDALVGGEESGGYGFRGHVPERDGILAGLYFLDLMVATGRTPSALIRDLYDLVGPHYYDRLDIRFDPEAREAIVHRLEEARPEGLDESPVAGVDSLDGVRFRLADGSWLLIRFSGTEPLMRIYAETDSEERCQRLLAQGRALAGV
jgi:phosphomannomutase